MKTNHAESTDQIKLDKATWLCLLKPRWAHWNVKFKPSPLLTIGPAVVTITRDGAASLLRQTRSTRNLKR